MPRSIEATSHVLRIVNPSGSGAEAGPRVIDGLLAPWSRADGFGILAFPQACVLATNGFSRLESDVKVQNIRAVAVEEFVDANAERRFGQGLRDGDQHACLHWRTGRLTDCPIPHSHPACAAACRSPAIGLRPSSTTLARPSNEPFTPPCNGKKL